MIVHIHKLTDMGVFPDSFDQKFTHLSVYYKAFLTHNAMIYTYSTQVSFACLGSSGERKPDGPLFSKEIPNS